MNATADRHADTDELLALRAGEGSAWAREHVAGCRACSAELFALEQMRARLRALPTFAPPRDRWPLVAAAARDDRRRRWRQSVVGVATAAALTGLTFLALRPAVPDVAAERAALERAITRSQALEQALKAIGPERQALRGDAARAVAELEDRLMELDARIAAPRLEGGQALDLWRERAGVLGALVDVRTTRVAAAGL